MKKHTFRLALICAIALFTIYGCQTNAEYANQTFEYSVSVSATDLQNAPALQSFAHGVSGSQWLLFAGRTNQDLDDGGLHAINNGNYANTSFVPWSFNENILVYDVSKDASSGMSFDEMVSEVSSLKPKSKLIKTLKDYATVFRNTNPLVTQEGDYVYLVGGYGTPMDNRNTSNAYQTFGHVARLHVPSVISLVTKTDQSSIDWGNIFAFGKNDTLRSTGAEVFKIDDTFYLAGGHNFGSSVPQGSNGQKYVDAVYPFTLSKPDSFSLNVTIKSPITDLAAADVGKPSSDNKSTFRRRDGPVVPALFYDQSNQLTEGLTFYAGVFQRDSTVGQTTWNRAWNTAIYIHPGVSVSNPAPQSPYFTLDKAYNQNNLNVYATADFELYDANSEVVHTFLFGGIGDGKFQKDPSMLSAFTDSLMHIQYDLKAKTSTPKVGNTNVFGNTGNYYGAESAFIYSTNGALGFTQAGGNTTEILDAVNTTWSNNQVEIGYIYGGIEAYEKAPGTFGPGKSAASKKVWKVTLTRRLLTY